MTAPRARSARRLTYLLTYLKAGSKRDKLCVMLESPLLSPPFPALWEIRSQPSAVGPVAKVSADRRSTPRPIAPPDANLSPALLQAALPNALLSRLCVLSAQPMPGLCASRSFAHNEARHPASARLHTCTAAPCLCASASDSCPDRFPHLNQVGAAMLLSMSARRRDDLICRAPLGKPRGPCTSTTP